MTKNSWIKKVNDNKNYLSEFILNWHSSSTKYSENSDMKITAPNAEQMCNVVREEIIKNEKQKDLPIDRFNKALDENDIDEIYSLLSDSWFGVPESTSCWKIKGFSVACDLLDDFPNE